MGGTEIFLEQGKQFFLGAVADGGLAQLSVFENQNGGNTGNAEAPGQVHLLVHIDLADGDVRPRDGDLLHNGGDHLAGSAPAGPEVHQHGAGGDGLVKILFVQMQHG